MNGPQKLHRHDRDGIFRRSDGKYGFSLAYFGQRIRKTGFDTYKEAAEARTLAESQLKNEGRFSNSRERCLTFNEVAAAYLEAVKPTVAPSTWTRYRELLAHLQWCFGARPIVALFHGDVEHYRDRRKAEFHPAKNVRRLVSPAEVNRELAVGRQLFNFATTNAWVKVNPFEDGKQLREPRVTRYLELHELRALLEALPDDLRPLAWVAVMTGIRKSDLLAATWGQVKLETHQLGLVQRKTKEPLMVELERSVVDTLRALWEQRMRRPPSERGSHVFVDRHGRPLKEFGRLRRQYAKAVEKSGLSGVGFHTLRHTTGSQLKAAGYDLLDIQKILGHKSYQATLRYVAVGNDQVKRAVEGLGKRLRGASEGLIVQPSSKTTDESSEKEGQKAAFTDEKLPG